MPYLQEERQAEGIVVFPAFLFFEQCKAVYTEFVEEALKTGCLPRKLRCQQNIYDSVRFVSITVQELCKRKNGWTV